MDGVLVIVGEGDAAQAALARARELGVEAAVAPPGGPLPDAASAVVGVGGDGAFRAAAALAERLGVVHPHAAAGALAGTDAGVARARLAAAGIPQPPWRECATAAEARAAAAELGWPVLVRSLGEEVRATAAGEDELDALVDRAIAASHRPACVLERKRGGGCSRERRPDVDAALGCASEAKVVAGEVVAVRALGASLAPAQAVDEALAATRASAP